jgi:hypothetical protein
LTDVFLGPRSAIQFSQGERVHIKLGYLVASSNEPHELRLGGRQGCIRHHIEQADVKFANVLVLCPLERQHFLTALLQTRKCRQFVMCNQGHGFRVRFTRKFKAFDALSYRLQMRRILENGLEMTLAL